MKQSTAPAGSIRQNCRCRARGGQETVLRSMSSPHGAGIWPHRPLCCLGSVRRAVPLFGLASTQSRTLRSAGNKWQSSVLRISRSSIGHQGCVPHFARPSTSPHRPCRDLPWQGFFYLFRQYSERSVSVLVGLDNSNEAQNETRSICYRGFLPASNRRQRTRSSHAARQS